MYMEISNFGFSISNFMALPAIFSPRVIARYEAIFCMHVVDQS